MRTKWMPRSMRVAPKLDSSLGQRPMRRRHALLIRHRLTARIWRPLVEFTRRRHLRFRRRLELDENVSTGRSSTVISAGV
ncbi:MAG: hypothetical protein ABGX07_14700 [Pirellulaceae bacterium]